MALTNMNMEYHFGLVYFLNFMQGHCIYILIKGTCFTAVDGLGISRPGMIRSLGLASASSLEKRIKKELQEQGVLEADYGNEVRNFYCRQMKILKSFYEILCFSCVPIVAGISYHILHCYCCSIRNCIVLLILSLCPRMTMMKYYQS